MSLTGRNDPFAGGIGPPTRGFGDRGPARSIHPALATISLWRASMIQTLGQSRASGCWKKGLPRKPSE